MGLIKDMIVAKALDIPIKALDAIDKLFDDQRIEEHNNKYREKLFKNHPQNKHFIISLYDYSPQRKYQIFDESFEPIYYVVGKEIKKKASLSLYDMKKKQIGNVQGKLIKINRLFKTSIITINIEFDTKNQVGTLFFSTDGRNSEIQIECNNWRIEEGKKSFTIFKSNIEIGHIEIHRFRGIYVIDMQDEQDKVEMIALTIAIDAKNALEAKEIERETPRRPANGV